MKTQTEVEIKLNSLQPLENLHIEPEGYLFKFFLGCSQIYSRPFKIRQQDFTITQTLKIKNILGDQIQVWLSTLEDKIIANATIPLIKEGEQESQIQLKLNGMIFAKLDCSFSISKKQIEKIVYVEPDEELLKKQQDSQAIRIREQQQEKRLRQKDQEEKLAQKQKKHPITVSYRNKRDQPFQ